MAEPDYSLMDRLRQQERMLTNIPVDGGGGGGDDGGMDERLKQLEHAVAVIEAKLPDLATNDGVDARLSKTETKIILWVVGAVVATGIGGKFISPNTAPVATPQPIIIQVPQSAGSTQPAVQGAPPAAATPK